MFYVSCSKEKMEKKTLSAGRSHLDLILLVSKKEQMNKKLFNQPLEPCTCSRSLGQLEKLPGDERLIIT